MLRFGTDGIRGDAAAGLPTELVVALGRAAARVTGAPRFLVARDTRASGPRLVRDLATGFALEGARCESAGVLPTPGLAVLSRERDEWAAMISASHNVWSDNGIKFFAPGGSKLSDAHQSAIEVELHALAAAPAPGGLGAPDGADSSAIASIDDARDVYERYLLGQLAPGALQGLEVVLDCAHGAAFEVAPDVFAALGAEVTVLHAAPDGRNINAGCGSTHPEVLQAAVVARGAHLGLAFDGDADRVLAVDERGALIDGDQIMAIMALALRARGALPGDRIAVTVMSNLGLRRALEGHGIGVVETPVGDRQVVAAMVRDGLALGGEQSGHIIFGDRAGTGDGTLTGLLLAAEVAAPADTGPRPLSELAAVMERLPQVLVNVRLAAPLAGEANLEVERVTAEVAQELGRSGRILVRPSGTEPMVRVMVEAPTAERATAAAQRVAEVLRNAAGPNSA